MTALRSSSEIRPQRASSSWISSRYCMSSSFQLVSRLRRTGGAEIDRLPEIRAPLDHLVRDPAVAPGLVGDGERLQAGVLVAQTFVEGACTAVLERDCEAEPLCTALARVLLGGVHQQRAETLAPAALGHADVSHLRIA